MPTYQYACTECGHQFEIVQSFSEDSLTVCPECEGRLRKVYNAVGVVFKGPGFYRNDSRGSESTTSSESKASDTKGEKKTEKKTESTPSTTSDSSSSSSTSSSTKASSSAS